MRTCRTPASGGAANAADAASAERPRACWGSSVARAGRPRRRGERELVREGVNAHVVLKGNGSVLAARDGHWYVNTGHKAMGWPAPAWATRCSPLGAMLAQGSAGETALGLGARLHGAAADALVRCGCGTGDVEQRRASCERMADK